MKPVIDMSKEYGIVFDGGGARGAYQIGAWKALKEAGVKINAVAGTSVGALNGALVCMGDVDTAEDIWRKMTFSTVMDVDDEWMERLFHGEITVKEFLEEGRKKLKDGGIDITPLRKLIHETVDEEKIRTCGVEFALLTFSVSDFKELDLSIEDIPEGLLEDFLLASAYLIGFKNERLHGKKYIDGGVVNNVPLKSLVKRGYKNIIEIRIYGPGREPHVKMPEDSVKYEVAPRVKLGSIIEFSGKRSRQNMTIGYYDAKRMLYGLEGFIYYIEQIHGEEYFEKLLSGMREFEKAEIALKLKLSIGFTDKDLFMGMLEAAAKIFQIPKYQIYTDEQLYDIVYEKYEKTGDRLNLPRFVHVLAGLREEPAINLKGRNFITLKDYTPEEILYLLDLAADLKEKKRQGITGESLKGRNIALLFEKPSTRTRCAFTVGAADEGGIPICLSGNERQLEHEESIEDTARVLGRMFDGIGFCGFRQEHVESLAKYSGIPVWNGLTDEDHPIQVLADLLTMREHFGYLKGLKLAYLGDGRGNMANSLMTGCAKLGVDFVIIAPECLHPAEGLVSLCKDYAEAAGSSITVTDDAGAVADADILYTDVWVSMGEEDKAAERIRLLTPYQVNAELMEKTGKEETIFMHCLPAVKGKEVTEDVFESEASMVFDEAENLLHTIKAVMTATLGTGYFKSGT